MKPLAYVRMVLWSFLGIRRGAAAGEEMSSAKPLVIVATAVGLVVVFVIGLVALAQLAADSLN